MAFEQKNQKVVVDISAVAICSKGLFSTSPKCPLFGRPNVLFSAHLSSQTSFAGEQTSKFVTDGNKVLISSHFFQMIPYWFGPGIPTVRAVLVVIVMKQQGQLNVPAHLC